MSAVSLAIQKHACLFPKCLLIMISMHPLCWCRSRSIIIYCPLAIIYYYLLLSIIIYYYLSLSIIIYYYLLLSIIIYHYLLLSIIIYYYGPII